MAYSKSGEPLICYTFYKCLGHVPGYNIMMIPGNRAVHSVTLLSHCCHTVCTVSHCCHTVCVTLLVICPDIWSGDLTCYAVQNYG